MAGATAPRPFGSLGVVGAGAWGTALAHLAAAGGTPTTLWAREPEVAAAIAARHENPYFLPGAALDPRLAATARLDDLAACEAFLFVVPVQFARPVMAALAGRAEEGAPVCLASKGLERGRGLLTTEMLAEAWPGARCAVLSGPSFAHDVVDGLPTAVTLAAADDETRGRWIATLGRPHFRLYASDDPIGAELGGAVKNVLAVAAGVVVGLGLGESARAALIARGFAEFRRLAVALGGRAETTAGLSGLGDLVLTATSARSRNMSLGIALGEGRPLAEIVAERRTVAEGAAAAEAVAGRAAAAGVDMPVVAAVADLVAGRLALDDIVSDLLARPVRREGE